MVVLAPQVKTVDTAYAKPIKRGHPVNMVIAVVAWQIIALLFVESILYTAGLGEEEIFRLDPVVGFTHIPNKRVTWRQEGSGSRSYFDNDGMREPNLTIAKPVGTYRIALLGDSMVEGLQVPIEQTFGAKLAQDLTKQMGRPVQVLNFGNSGYSTAQEYLQLKRKVLKYNPDLVMLGYSNRDIYENWSPPDQTITNVRPYALHLPGGRLVVESSPVTQWMKTPRAKFLMQIGWIREYSRSWGTISAMETQLSQTDPACKALLAFFTNPVKCVRAFCKTLPQTIATIPQSIAAAASGPSFRIQFFEGEKERKLATFKEAAKEAAVQSSILVAPNTIPNIEAERAAEAQSKKQKKTFDDLLTHTLGSLFAEMKKECTQHGAKFCIVAMPCKGELCPSKKVPFDNFQIPFSEEVNIVSKLSAEQSIPFLNSSAPAHSFGEEHKNRLFYFVHLTPEGHSYLADTLNSFLSKQIK